MTNGMTNGRPLRINLVYQTRTDNYHKGVKNGYHEAIWPSISEAENKLGILVLAFGIFTR